MSRTWRGVRARGAGLLTLAATSLVVVGGAVTVVGYADRAGASLMLAAPLVLLGLVAVPSTGHELGSARREEIAVARLRGLYGGALVRLVAVEPAIAVAGGGLLGYALGTAGVWLTARAWLDVSATWAGRPATIVAVLLVLATLAAVLVGMARSVREPLSEQVAIAERPRPMTTWATFVSLLVVVAAGVATYRAQSRSTHDPDWVVLVGPAFVALASGQVSVWLLRLVTRLAVARSVRSRVPTYLAVRRLRGTAGMAGPVRLLVSATVLATLALAGAGRVSAWADRTARLESGAAIQVPFDEGALGVLQLTRNLDPQGHWLMAAAFVPDRDRGSARRAFLDTGRYDAVVGDFLDQGVGQAMSPVMDSLREGTEPPQFAKGDRGLVALTTAGTSAPRARTLVEVRVDYINDDGSVGTASVRMPLGRPGVPRSHGFPIPDCHVGCVATAVAVSELRPQRYAYTTQLGRVGAGAVLITDLRLGQRDLLTLPWAQTSDSDGKAVLGPAGLLVTPARSGEVVLEPERAPLPVVAVAGTSWRDGSHIIKTPGGVERPADVVGTLAAGPFVQATGLVADLPAALAGDAPTVPAAEVFVLARQGTPRAMLDALSAAGGGKATPLDDVRARIVAETGAGQAQAFALMAAFCLAVALLVLVASAARLRTSYRHEAAALRLLGIPSAQLRRAGRAETTLLALTAVVAGSAGGVLAVSLLLGSLPVVRLPADALALGTATPWWAVGIAVGVAAVALAVVQVVSRGGSDRATRPATLREGVTE